MLDGTALKVQCVSSYVGSCGELPVVHYNECYSIWDPVVHS